MAGDVGFDPLGLSNIDDIGIDLYWLREAEIKHCRLTMLAVAGIVQVELFGPAPGCEMATAKCQMDAFWQLWGAHPQYIAFGLIMIMIAEMVGGHPKVAKKRPSDTWLWPFRIQELVQKVPPDNSGNSQHRKTTMLDLGLTKQIGRAHV